MCRGCPGPGVQALGQVCGVRRRPAGCHGTAASPALSRPVRAVPAAAPDAVAPGAGHAQCRRPGWRWPRCSRSPRALPHVRRRRRCGPMGSRAAGGEQPPGARRGLPAFLLQHGPGRGSGSPAGCGRAGSRERDGSLGGAGPGARRELRLQLSASGAG